MALLSFTASDLADFLDAQDEKHWRQHDEWLIEMQQLGDVHPILLFASWFGDRSGTVVPRTISTLTGGFIDVLRLGNDIDLESEWGIAKGAALNGLRLAQIVGPAARAVAAGGRYAGLTATSLLKNVPHGGPCRFVALNNAMSFLSGKTQQLFATVSQIDEAQALKPGANMIDQILKNPRIAAFMEKAGYTWRDIGSPRTFEEAIDWARRSDGPLVVAVDFLSSSGKGVLKESAHRLTLVKDSLGRVRILDYSPGKGFQGFASLEDMWKARPQWVGIESATMRPSALLFESGKVRLLEAVGKSWIVAFPVAVGVRFGQAKSLDQAAAEIARSIWDYLVHKLGDDAPPLPDLLTNETTYTKTILTPRRPPYWYDVRAGIPQDDWPSGRAGSAYGDVLLWPIIFNATREEERKAGQPIWADQNKLKPGQRIFVPDLADYSKAEIDAARKRGKDWKRIGP